MGEEKQQQRKKKRIIINVLREYGGTQLQSIYYWTKNILIFLIIFFNVSLVSSYFLYFLPSQRNSTQLFSNYYFSMHFLVVVFVYQCVVAL